MSSISPTPPMAGVGVVKRDVAAHDGEVERAAGLGHAFDGGHDLAHDFRALRRTEVEIVGHRQRRGSHGGEIAPAFCHRLLAALVGIGLHVARRHIARDRKRAV
jgi:hypothetical protein